MEIMTEMGDYVRRIYNIIIMFSSQSSLNDIPNDFLCPITMTIMRDPVMTSDGYTFERQAISDWWEKGKITNPMTNLQLQNASLTPNRVLKSMIQQFMQKKQKTSPKKSFKAPLAMKTILKSTPYEKSQTQQIQKQKIRKPKLQSKLSNHKDIMNQTCELPSIKNRYAEENSPEKIMNQTVSPKLVMKSKQSITSASSSRMKTFNSPFTRTIEEFEELWEEFEKDTLVWLLNFKSYLEGLPSQKKYENGKYRGQLEQMEHHGYGILTFKNGNQEYGEWKNGLLSGKAAQYIKKVQKLHSGIFQKNKLNGLGEIRDTRLRISLYKGTLEDNKKNGFGIEFDPETQKTYKGYFVGGKKHGKGREYNFLGDFYEGQWVDNLKHGRGVRVKRDDFYEQFWVKGKEEGAQGRNRQIKRANCGCNGY